MYWNCDCSQEVTNKVLFLFQLLFRYGKEKTVNEQAMLLCFVFPGGRRRSEPDEAELLRVSRQLVDDAVNRALQQYKQETLQNGSGPRATAVQHPGNTEETATKMDTTANSTTDNRKWHHQTEVQGLKTQLPRKHHPGLAKQLRKPWAQCLNQQTSQPSLLTNH